MKTTLRIFSIIAIVIGALAILSSPTAGYDAAGNAAFDIYAFMGGGLFLTQGVLALAYIGQEK
jgi:hypothetical protein